LHELGLTHVEISDGVIDLPRERKLELIEDFARDFTVLSEVGSKDADVEFTPDEWTTWLREELAAGAWKVITEAREGGTAGIFSNSGDMRTDLVGEIASGDPLEDVVRGADCRLRPVHQEYGPAAQTPGTDTLKEVLRRARHPARTSSDDCGRSAAWAYQQLATAVHVLVAAVLRCALFGSSA
jgi:hypothetical protein